MHIEEESAKFPVNKVFGLMNMIDILAWIGMIIRGGSWILGIQSIKLMKVSQHQRGSKKKQILQNQFSKK